MVLCGDRRYDDALEAARKALAMQPELGVARSALQIAFVLKGMRDELLAYHREWITRDGELVAAFEQGLAEAGYEGAHRRIADVMAARLEKSGRVVAPGGFGVFAIATQYLYAGDYDRTIDWLEKSYEAHNPNLPYISFDPLYDPLRSDPRFQNLLRRMNLPTPNVGSDPDEQK